MRRSGRRRARRLTGVELAPGAARRRPAAAGRRRCPTFRRRSVAGASVVVRLHAVATGRTASTVMAGGNGGCSAPATIRGGRRRALAKDVWVLGAHAGAGDRRRRAAAGRPRRVACRRAPPTRCSGSAGGRAGRGDRHARRGSSPRAWQQDPALASFDGGRWARRMAHVLRAVRRARRRRRRRGRPADRRARRAGRGDATPWPSELGVAARRGGDGARVPVGHRRAGARAARRASRDELRDGPAADRRARRVHRRPRAFVGLWNESTVRGPAWRFGDIGRRIERALVVLDLVAVRACPRRRPTGRATDVVDAPRSRCCWPPTRASSPTAATTAATSSSAPTVALLLRDVDNPRSVRGVDRAPRRARRRRASGPTGPRPSPRWRRWSPATTPLDARAGGHERDRRRSAGSSSRRGSRRPSTRCVVRRPMRHASDANGPCALPRRAPHDVPATRSRWPTATRVAYLLPRPTACSRSSSAARSTSTPEPDERAEHIDVFGNRVLQIGVHHAHDALTLRGAAARSSSSRLDADRRRRAVGGRRRRGSASCAAATRSTVRPFAGARRTSTLDDHGAALRALADESFTPGRPIVDGGAAICAT